MLDKIWEWLKFKATHRHETFCTGEGDRSLTSSERHYWHIVECRWCDKRWSELIDDHHGREYHSHV